MDYSGIYEAYQQIYEVQWIPLSAAKAAKLTSTSHIKSPKYKAALRNLIQSLENPETPATPATPEVKKRFPHSFEVREGRQPDIAVSYLLDAGYADTYEAAEHIIGAMSEEWFNDIVEANRGEREAGLSAIR